MPATTLADRAVIRVSGEDVRGFLQGLVTQEVMGKLPVWAGLLTAQGKCLFDFIVWGDGDDLLLDCEAEAADDLIKRLSIYRLRRPISIGPDESMGFTGRWTASRGCSTPACRSSAGVGLGRQGNPHPAGSNTAFASACARGARSLATCSGLNATRPN
jgi:folate-binding Fe-S cluster repair protein YgfZ